MIVADGVPFSANSSSTSTGKDSLLALLENPFLISASSSLKATREMRFSLSGESGTVRSKWVYVFQREYATVDPAHADLVGTDEATTCVGLVIRNRRNGMTSLAHTESPNIVDMGISQMLSLLIDHSLETELEVHLIGSFEDVSQKVCPGSSTFLVISKM
ncbi:hypothetical protein L6164_018029 [Bauhinia variegata]|uniref:Uncharacterized protein n=1 Tax=Bauhinia variegata TaxID=167791 RepID=A0ACB9NB34_BAUVA|nr:hypothetical protein L6164_018029 [Bauhinia variegata]